MWCYYSIDERNEFHKISKKSKNQKIRNQKKKGSTRNMAEM